MVQALVRNPSFSASGKWSDLILSELVTIEAWDPVHIGAGHTRGRRLRRYVAADLADACRAHREVLLPGRAPIVGELAARVHGVGAPEPRGEAL
jgi:hypothetical protein